MREPARVLGPLGDQHAAIAIILQPQLFGIRWAREAVKVGMGDRRIERVLAEARGEIRAAGA